MLWRAVELGTDELLTAVLLATMAMLMLTQLKAMLTQLEAVMAMEAELPEPMASC